MGFRRASDKGVDYRYRYKFIVYRVQNVTVTYRAKKLMKISADGMNDSQRNKQNRKESMIHLVQFAVHFAI